MHKNTSNTRVKNPQKKTASQTLLRGPGGKFLSKKTAEKAQVNEPTETFSAHPETKIKGKKTSHVETIFLTATFYGQAIRKFYISGSWYFSIEDMLPLAQYFEPHEDLQELKRKEEFKKTFDKLVKEIRDSGNVVECVNYGGFIELLPMLRSEVHMFPGPFPSWLEDTSKLPNASPT